MNYSPRKQANKISIQNAKKKKKLTKIIKKR